MYTEHLQRHWGKKQFGMVEDEKGSWCARRVVRKENDGERSSWTGRENPKHRVGRGSLWAIAYISC